ncbi:MAG: putative sulfoacetate transporter SauU [Bryobacteraceae bacterium]|nr:putative sulfoacetate transporter SauU [Bryobacteraceae bacterium]
MKFRLRVLLLLFLLSIITYIDRVCISVAGPRMQQDLGITPERWGWVVGAFTLSYAAFEIPSGALADKLGARSVLTRIVLWWSIFTSLTGAVSNFFLLLLVRFCFGAGEAGAYPGSTSAVARWFPPRERARATSVFWMASRLGGVLAPILVVAIQQRHGWRASFYVFGILGVLWCAVWYWWYRDHPTLKPGISESELHEIGAGSISEHTSLPWGIALRQWNYWKILLMYHTYCWGGYFYLSWLHTYLQKGLGFSENEMAIWSTLPFLFGACGNLVGGYTSDLLIKRRGLSFGRRSVGAAGLALSGIFMLLTSQTDNKQLAVIFLALGYGSMDCMLPVSWAVCMDVGGKFAGAISGSMNMAGQLGSFFTSIVFGYVVAATHSYNAPLLYMGVMLLVSALLFVRIDPTQPLIREDDARNLSRATPPISASAPAAPRSGT